jgi:hypothetical protein
MSEQLQVRDGVPKRLGVWSAQENLSTGRWKNTIGRLTEDASQALDRATLRSDARREDRSVEVS